MVGKTLACGVVLMAGLVATVPALAQGVRVPMSSVARVLIDVRSPEEFSDGHLARAVNLPHEEIGRHIARVVPDRKTPVILYCASGRRSGLALDVLRQMGYSNAINGGGYEQMRAAGWR